MNSEQLIHQLYSIGAIKFGEFILKSGAASKLYLDLRQIISHPQLLRAVSFKIGEQIKNVKFDIICGVPYTALPIATCISLHQDIPMIMRRKEKKTYGTKQTIEGNYSAGQTCLVIEDLITTGGSILETIADLKEVGLQVKDVAMLIDREQGGKDNLQNKNLSVHAVFGMNEVLKTLLRSPLLNETERDIANTLLFETI